MARSQGVFFTLTGVKHRYDSKTRTLPKHPQSVPNVLKIVWSSNSFQQARMHASSAINFDARHSILQLHYYPDDIASSARFCYYGDGFRSA
jgi:hypothetical protein